jgi:glycosyltransferase involved in cell wall biosynthesis
MSEEVNIERVSVVVPTYNQSRYLPVCLDTILFQNYPNIEIIVVNDGSTDDTAKVLENYQNTLAAEITSYVCNYNQEFDQVERRQHRRYQQKGRELRIIHHLENRGLGATLNTGFAAATGQLCTFIASDDMFLPTAMSEMVAALEQNDADFVYADMHIVDDAGRILRLFSLPEYSFENAFCRWYLCGICKLFRRELHEKVGYYREDIKPQDHEMFLRFAMNGAKFIHVSKVLANVRIHDKDRLVHNHSSANWDRLYRESAELVLKARRFLQQV